MPIDNPDIQPWPLKDSEIAADFKIFKVRSDQRTSPRTGDDHSFFVIESVDWCNVVALTANDELVMVEQYRQGVVFELHPKGVVYVFDFYTLVLVLVSGAVMLQLAKIVADMVAFYLLFDGRYSDYLRTKRKEVATLEHERAEVAEAATLALVALKALDEIGDGGWAIAGRQGEEVVASVREDDVARHQ